jgi:signal transduction histidine kinase
LQRFPGAAAGRGGPAGEGAVERRTVSPPAQHKSAAPRRWVWVLAWAVLSLAAAGFSWRSHHQFSSAIAEAFNRQQGLGVRLIERLVQQHINEAMLLLIHVKDEIRKSAESGRPDFESSPAAIAARRIDQFISLSVVDENGRVLFASQPQAPWNPLTIARADRIDPETVMTPFLSERVFTQDGQPTAFVFVPFRLPGGEGGLYYVAGELNLRHYLLTALEPVVGKDIGLLIADYEGDIYLIANVEHELLSMMQHGNLFTAETKCHGCHAPGSFDDLRHTVIRGEQVHALYRTPRGATLNRMSGAIGILNESWIVSTSIPYATVQGQIAANARNSLIGAGLVLFLLAAAGWGLRGAQRRRDVERQNEELRVVDRMKDALLRDVAHELKTPVAKHAMQLEILRPLLTVHRITPQEQRAFVVMEESIRRQQSVVRNLLNLTRLEAGGRVYRKEPLSLATVLRRVQEDYQYAFDSYGIDFCLEVPEMTLVGDEEMLWHVFSNLVNNAIKFRRQEGQPHIAVRARVEGERVSVRVEDDGIGLSAEELEKVFTRFYQGTASSEGSGVGLSICKRITEDLGGRIRMESPGKGKGCTAVVELPLG